MRTLSGLLDVLPPESPIFVWGLLGFTFLLPSCALSLVVGCIIWVLVLTLAVITYGPLVAAEWKLEKGSPPIPPGTMGLPYWGESLEYLRSWNNMQNPDVWCDVRKAKYGDVFKTHILGAPTVVMLGPDANKFILTNENKLFETSWPFSVKQLEGRKSVVVVQGNEHKRLRRALVTFLNIDALKRFMGNFEEVVVKELHENWKSSTIIHVYPALKKLTFQIGAELLMGLKPGAELHKFQQHHEAFKRGLVSHPLDFPGTVFHEAKKARNALMREYFEKINMRRKELSEAGDMSVPQDLLDLFLVSKDEETGSFYTNEEIGDNLLLMTQAAEHNNVSVLVVILKHLSENKDILMQLKKECRKLAKSKASGQHLSWEELKSIDSLRCVILEGMRMCPSVSGIFKRAKCNVIYNGYTIPKGWQVLCNLRHTLNKPEFFQEPAKFNPSRFEKRRGTYTFIPFGQGSRMCPGIDLAMLSMELFLYHFLIGYEWDLVDTNEKILVQPLFPYPEKGFPIKLKYAC